MRRLMFHRFMNMLPHSDCRKVRLHEMLLLDIFALYGAHSQ